MKRTVIRSSAWSPCNLIQSVLTGFCRSVGVKARWRPASVCAFPGFVRIIELHVAKILQRARTEILLINNTLIADNEGLHSGNAVFGRSRSEGKSPDHCSLDNKIHFSERCCRTLAF